jgi:hypothetical protein
MIQSKSDNSSLKIGAKIKLNYEGEGLPFTDKHLQSVFVSPEQTAPKERRIGPW